jgi:hypothetical protein
MEDYKYTLEKLVNAIDEFVKQINIYPHTEKTFKDLEKADLNLNTALSLAKEILNNMK